MGEVLRVVGGRGLFRVFFLRDDDVGCVRVNEVFGVDFEEVRLHLERGESVFISRWREAGLGLVGAKGKVKSVVRSMRDARDYSRKDVGGRWFADA